MTSAGGPSATIAPVLHGHEVVGVAAGQVEVVQDEHDGAALALVEVGEQVEHLDLVGEVEERRRLVEQHQRRALGEGERDPHPLALAAGELVDAAIGQVGDLGGVERRGHRRLVLDRELAHPPLVRVAAAGRRGRRR